MFAANTIKGKKRKIRDSLRQNNIIDTLFYKKELPKIYGHAKKIPDIEKKRRFLISILISDTTQIMEIICFSANVRQCNIAHIVVHVKLCFESVLTYCD